METKDLTETRLKDLLAMKVAGYIVYPSIILDNKNKLSVEFLHQKDLYEEALNIYNTLFERVTKMSSEYLINDNKSTIVLEDESGKRWFLNKYDHTINLSDNGIRQGWDYEFDPTADPSQNKENYFFQKNLWFC